jgi:hypothetical protein
MTNQEAFEAARAGDWIAETFNRVGDVFYVGGSSAGYSSFTDCLSDGQSVFYSAFDSDDSREAGLAVWDASAKTLTPVEIHASLIGAAFIKGDPEPVNFPNGGTITGTLNATAFNTIWRHVFEKGNPHETEASQIDQSNEELGDTVQDALNKIATIVDQLDPDGDTNIDWGDLDGLQQILDAKAEQSALEQEILDRIAGDKEVQDQLTAALDQEILERKAADENLQDQIEAAIIEGGAILEAPDDGKQYARQSESWSEVLIPDAAAGMVISATEPPIEDRVEGMQWLDSTTAMVWIWDGAKWLEFPGVGSPGESGEDGVDGKDGEDGKDGKDGDSFFTDISSETGINTIERFGDEVWVTQFKSGELFAGAKLGNDIFCSGTFRAGTGTFVGGSIGLQFNSNDDIIPVDDSGNAKVGVDLGTNSAKFMNGRFSGEVSATSLVGSASVESPSIRIGDFTIEMTGDSLDFKVGGVSVVRIAPEGKISAKDDITGFWGS